MCFSPAASFTASAALGTIGIATLGKVRSSREVPLAFVPIIFAVQQAIEGLLWLSLLRNSADAFMLSSFFAFFALAWWPMYVPFTVYMLETDVIRKKLMVLLLGGGTVFALSQYGLFVYRHEAAQIINQCIYYHIQTPLTNVFVVLYGLATVGAGLFSSRRFVKIFSLLIGLFAMISWRYYTVTFASVWCFFAAVLSAIILFYFTQSRK